MNKELKKLKRLLTIAIDRNDTKQIIRLRKLLIDSDDSIDLEELTGLFDD